jgi:antitoxin MazE
MGVLKHIDAKGGIVLPKEMRVGVDLVEVECRSDGVIELRPKVAVDASQSWFWTERWQQMEQEADEDIRAGRVIRSDNADDFLAELDSGAAH